MARILDVKNYATIYVHKDGRVAISRNGDMRGPRYGSFEQAETILINEGYKMTVPNGRINPPQEEAGFVRIAGFTRIDKVTIKEAKDY